VTPNKAALAEVRAVIDLQAAQVDRLDKESMRALLPALVDARNELARDLAAWLRDAPDGDERFTAQQYRRAMVALDAAMDRIRSIAPEMEAQLQANAHAAGAMSREHLIEQVARFGAAFGESVYPTDLELAAVIAKGDELLIPRYRTSAARYANGMTEDIRHQLAVGVARNETWAQMKARLVRHGGPKGLVATRGVLGDPGATAEYIAEGLFRRHRYWAERLVRTELVQAYNVQHQTGIDLLNETRDPARTAEYVQRWDATLDRRACPICKGLDRRVAKIGGQFKGGYHSPPAHPQCRCLVVAWHVSWGDISGEVPAVEDATDPLPALPRTVDKPQRKVSAKRAAAAATATAPPIALPDPGDAAADRAMDLVARGRLTNARRVLDADLERDGLPQTATLYQATNKVRTRTALNGNGTHSPRDGLITLRADRAQHAQAFAKDWRADKAAVRAALQDAASNLDAFTMARAARVTRQADSMRTLVHEVHHGHGPLSIFGYNGHGVFTEEVVTEWAARSYMRRRFGVPASLFTADAHPMMRMGSYRGWCAKLVEAVQDTAGLTREAATEAVEAAALAFKRLPRGSILSGDNAVDQLATLLPGDADVYKVKLRAISRRDPHDES
jgi:hypothetical protein